MSKKLNKIRGRRFLSLVLALVMCVSLLNITALATDGPGTSELICGLTEGEGAHTHTEACYDQTAAPICGKTEDPGHTHTEACYNHTIAPICGYEEGEGAHTHDDSCYSEEKTLTCGQDGIEGHEHTDDCYTTERTLTCGQEESEGHVHSSACAGTVRVGDPICGEEEREAHTHTYRCYPLSCGLEETEGHIHTEECYAQDEYGIMTTSLEEVPEVTVKEVKTSSDLAAAIKAAPTGDDADPASYVISVVSDISSANVTWSNAPEKVSFTLKLNGRNLTGSTFISIASRHGKMVLDGGGGTISLNSSNDNGIQIKNFSDVEFKDVKITGKRAILSAACPGTMLQ